MPEQNLPEVDLDRAFESLTRDLAGRPGAPGAAAAVATARRRRRTTLVSVAAVVVLAAGVVALPQLVGGSNPDRRTDVATSVDGDPVVFTGSALGAAVEGWAGPWTVPTSDAALEGVVFGEPRCLNEMPGPMDEVQPARRGDVFFVEEGTRSGAFATFADLGAGADTAPVLEALSPTAIEEACGVVVDTSTVGGAEVRHAHLPPGKGGPAFDVWLAASETRVSMLVVAAPDGSAPAEVQAKVATLLASALGADENFETSMSQVESTTSSGSATSEVDGVDHPTLEWEALHEATNGWPARIRTVGGLPCTEGFSLVDNTWGTATSDDRGFTAQHAGMGSVEAARASVDEVARQLRSCRRADWNVATGTLVEGRTLSAGTTEGTFVLVQRDEVLAWVTIGEPDAPRDAVEAIMGLLRQNLVQGGR